MRHTIFFVLIALFFLLNSCNTIDVYERTIAFPKHEWPANVRINFMPSVKDSLAYYNIYFVIRHTESYHFNNIWINFTSSFPKDTAVKQRLNIQLASGSNGWLGSAVDDIIEQRLLLNRQPVKLPAGNYTFSIQQIMREDPLQNVLNAGIRLEKVVQ